MQVPVVRTSVFQNGRIDTASVIANPQAKLPRIVNDFYLNVQASGMGEGVDNRLTSYGIRLLKDCGVQLPRAALDYRREGRSVAREFFDDMPECGRQVAQDTAVSRRF